MQTEQELEKFIASVAQTFRAKVPPGNREAVWLKISAHLREARLMKPTEQQSWTRWPFFLRSAWGKAGAVILTVLVAISLVGGVAKATPGQTLYPVKRAAERVEKVLTPGEEAKVKVTIKHAKRRLSEVQTLVAENGQQTMVQQTLTDLTNTTQDAIAASESKPQLKNQIVDIVTHEEKILADVQDQTEGEIKAAVGKALLLTQKSLNKLTTEDNNVEGASTAALENETQSAAQATSTAGLVKSKTSGKTSSKDGKIESRLQIDEVITIGENNNPIPEP